MRTFRDILVLPTQGLRNGVGRPDQQGLSGFFRGGPLWPFFALQITPRQCQGYLPLPRDRRPVPTAGATRTLPAGVWCGPVSPHFGHMISDFGSRIARSIAESQAPLVFSLGPDVDFEPRPFFWQILDHLGAGRREVILIREPTRFERLDVFPQEERVGAGSTSGRYLDLLDTLAAANGPRVEPIDMLFVSRAHVHDGKLAGEHYLEAALSRLGVVVMHPETLNLGEQLAHYRAARTIIASEGSALHGMQLLGRFDAALVVLVRRSGRKLARQALKARARSLKYWNCITGVVHGCGVHGRPQFDRALALIDQQALIARFRTIGLDAAAVWDPSAYADAVRTDVLRFAWYNKQLDLHPAALPMIQSCLDANRIDIDLNTALEGVS